jgi:putrescine transport system substrate-binding protein
VDGITRNCRLRRFSALVSITIGLTAAGCGASHDVQPIVSFYNWSDYIDPATLPAFTRETGIKVNYGTFESDETLEAELLAGHSGYDVVVPSSAYFARQIAAGVFRQIDRTRLHNYHELDPFVLAKLAVSDPGNR